ncbi:ferritin-like domain-containing protein [Paraconexibacter antarcticus]|uniref:Ferritin-like domain-containing protein n=1 Tax=Paraconexibacter antarcticus TaxID=2949664 RepID=A0ABY5DQ67_9ACTN|nr:DUF892 family protein [Paraconexibacter antarcticus]UTI63769.1 ferritin-like domain-containing protein [Paraconexibacter antarcticus]
MSSSETKTIHYLQDALVLEGTLRRTLIAHIALSPRDRHRELLEEHLSVTIAQERRLLERIAELQGPPSALQAAVGVAKTAAAVGFTLAKGPLDALRGAGGERVALRNLQDETASEALEIALYDTLEEVATRVGDTASADLAREHRAQEQAFLEQLRETMPEVARRDLEAGRATRRLPVSASGLVDAGRTLVTGVQAALRQGAEAPARPAPAKPAPAKPAPAKPAPAKPAAAEAAAPRPKAPAATSEPESPIAEYDDMTPLEITELLDHLAPDRLEAVEAYERANAAREQVLTAITEQREIAAGARR